MQPALISRTKRRGAAALATALRLLFLTASDMEHPCGGLTRNWSALDRDCAANTCHDIEWDDHRWNGCASSVVQRGSSPLSICTLRTRRIFWRQSMTGSQKGFCHCGHVRRCSLDVIALVDGIERTKLQIGARPDKRRNSR